MANPNATPQAKKDKLARQWKKFRTENLMTQEELARTLGVSRESINSIENGNHYPQFDLQRRMRALMTRSAAEKEA